MPRMFGKVGSTLDRSQKWWALPDDGARLAFTWLIWCQHGNRVGLFSLPPMYMAVGLRISLEEAEARLEAMEGVGLIDRGPDDLVRVVGWHRKHNAPRNPSDAIAMLRELTGRAQIDDCAARSRALMDFTHVTMTLCKKWDHDTNTFGQLMREMQGIIEAEYERIPDQTDAALCNLGLSKGDKVWGIMWDTVLALCHPRERGEREIEIEMEIEREREIERESQRPGTTGKADGASLRGPAIGVGAAARHMRQKAASG